MQGGIGLLQLAETVAHHVEDRRDRVQLQDLPPGLDALRPGPEPGMDLEQPDLVEDIAGHAGGEHEIGPLGPFVIPALEQAVGHFREDLFVERIRHDEG